MSATLVADYLEDCWQRGEWPPPPGTYKLERAIRFDRGVMHPSEVTVEEVFGTLPDNLRLAE